MARKPIQKDAQAFSPPPSPQREVRRAQIDIVKRESIDTTPHKQLDGIP